MKLLADLLTESHSSNYNPVIRAVVDFLRKNTDAKIVLQKVGKNKTNVIAIFGKPELLVNCHLDTVPPVGDWKTNPYKLVKKDGKLFGLGTCDTKGNIYASLMAAASVKPKNLMLLYSFDEEIGGKTGVRYFLKSKYVKGIKRAIVSEPTGLKFVNKHKGAYTFKVFIKTRGGHSSLAKGDNAIAKAAGLVLKFDRAGFNVGIISGGTRSNIVAANCEFYVSKRSYESFDAVLREVRSIAGKARLQILFAGVPFVNSRKPFIKAEMHEVGFWTEAALLNQAGIDSVVFGAGSIKQAHKNNEFIKEKELVRAQRSFERLFR